MKKILFICHGNICRSPMAEFVMKDMAAKAGAGERFVIDSAATSTEELGNPVYPPARRELAAFSEKRKILMNHPFLIVHIFHTSTLIVSRFLPGCNQPNATKPVRFGCENQTCPRMSLNSPGAWSVRLEPLSLLQRRLDFLPHLRLVGGHVVGAAVRP